jgi:5,10-methenyltetrahydrofolate synthetase
MWMDEEKALLRKAIREWPEPLTERLTEGAAAAEHLSRWPMFQSAGTVGCYASLSREIDTQPVLKLILETGKTLALPKTRGKGIMDFCRVNDPAFLHPGRLSILEPEEDAQIIRPEKTGKH